MRPMPALLAPGRRKLLARVSLFTLTQGAAAGAAAFATRALFQALNAQTPVLPFLPVAVLALSGLIIAASRVAARIQGERLGQDYALDLRSALFEHAAGMAVSDVAARRSGYMSLRFVGDMTAFRNWAGLGLPRLIAGAILIPTTAAVLGLLSPTLLAAVLPPLGLTLAMILLGGIRLVPLQRTLRARRGRIAADMAERMPLAPDLDRLGRRPRELRRLHDNTKRMIEAALARLRLAEGLKAIPDLMAGLMAALVILIGAREGLGTGTIAGTLAALGLLLSPMRDLASVWNLRSAWRAAHSKCADALARRQRSPYGVRSLPEGPAALRIDDLRLSGRPPFSCALDAGHRLAVKFGETAETALFDILLGLEAKPAGRILLSGIPLEELSRGTLRRNVCRIGPAVPLLKGSLRRALTMGVDGGIDDAAILKEIRRLNLGGVLCPDGDLDRRIAEGGRNLPASERTAISLVRAALVRPSLVLIGQDIAAAGPEMIAILRQWLDHRRVSVCHSIIDGGPVMS